MDTLNKPKKEQNALNPSLKNKDEHIKSVAIMHAIEIESNFKLYSYRIISHEQFVQRTKELIQYFNSETK